MLNQKVQLGWNGTLCFATPSIKDRLGANPPFISFEKPTPQAVSANKLAIDSLILSVPSTAPIKLFLTGTIDDPGNGVHSVKIMTIEMPAEYKDDLSTLFIDCVRGSPTKVPYCYLLYKPLSSIKLSSPTMVASRPGTQRFPYSVGDASNLVLTLSYE